MKRHEAEKLIETIRGFVEIDKPGKLEAPKRLEEQAPVGKALTMDRSTVEGTDNTGGHLKPFALPELEELYQQFKNRLIEECAIDPVLLQLLTSRPELVVEVEPRIVRLEGNGSDLKGRIARLLAAGFFDSPVRAGDINKELNKTGNAAAGNRLSEALDWLKKAGFLVLNGMTWEKAAGIKITEHTIETK